MVRQRCWEPSTGIDSSEAPFFYHSIHTGDAHGEKLDFASNKWAVVVDPGHPLYQKRLPVVSVSRGPQHLAQVLLRLSDDSVVKVPWRSTSLSTLVNHAPQAKLSMAVAKEFCELVMEYKSCPNPSTSKQ